MYDDIPDHETARSKAERILAGGPRRPALRALAYAYLSMAQGDILKTEALRTLLCDMPDDMPVREGATRVRCQLHDLEVLRTRLLAATDLDEYEEIAATLIPPKLTEVSDIDYSELSPNVRETVRRLRSWGYETTDSGDGTNFAEGMECSLPTALISITVANVDAMVAGVQDIFKRLREAGIPLYQGTAGVCGTVAGADMLYTIQVFGVMDVDFIDHAAVPEGTLQH